jgi:transposase InsO family protein
MWVYVFTCTINLGVKTIVVTFPPLNEKLTRESIFEYIKVDYNWHRNHSATGFINPEY